MLSWAWIIGGGAMADSPMSAPVNTWTPGRARASSTSMDSIVAWAA